MPYNKYKEGKWVKYRHHEGWISKGKILEVRPDGILIIGESENDTNPNHVSKEKVTETL